MSMYIYDQDEKPLLLFGKNFVKYNTLVKTQLLGKRFWKDLYVSTNQSFYFYLSQKMYFLYYYK